MSAFPRYLPDGNWRERLPARLRVVPPANVAGAPDRPGAHDRSDQVTLYRPIGVHELELLRENGFTELPSRKEWSAIALRLFTREDALRIAADRNAKRDPNGPIEVIAIHVDRSFADQHKVEVAGTTQHWIDASLLEELNTNLIAIDLLAGPSA